MKCRGFYSWGGFGIWTQNPYEESQKIRWKKEKEKRVNHSFNLVDSELIFYSCFSRGKNLFKSIEF